MSTHVLFCMNNMYYYGSAKRIIQKQKKRVRFQNADRLTQIMCFAHWAQYEDEQPPSKLSLNRTFSDLAEISNAAGILQQNKNKC